MAFTKEAIEAALERGHTIDITTTGRRSGKPRRLEIVFHNIGGRIHISGPPDRRERRPLLHPAADPPFLLSLKGKADTQLPPPARGIPRRSATRAGAPRHPRA